MVLILTALASLLVLIGASLSFLALREGSDDDDAPIKAPQRVSSQHGETVITLDPAAQRKAGIRTVRLRNASFGEPLRAYGSVLDAQPLTELSNRYVTARAQLEIARARLASSKLAFERAQKLFKDQQNMSSAQLQAAEAAYRTDRATFAAAQSELDTLAATAQQSWGGTLSEALINTTPLLTRLRERQEVLLQVTLRPGENASPSPTDAFVQMDDGTRVALRYVSPATRTDPHIQGASLFFTAPATAGLLPGMNVLVSVPTARNLMGTLVPQSAIIWTQGAPWAYLKSGTSQFARHGIPKDAPVTAEGYVVSLPDDTEVVVEGAQMLLSEEQKSQAKVTD
jgi:hypothetical protein